MGIWFSQVVKMSSNIWDILPCSPLKVNQLFRGTCRPHLQAELTICFMLVSSLTYSSIMKMEDTWSSKTLVDLQWTTWHYIPEDRTLHNHCGENLKSYIGSEDIKIRKKWWQETEEERKKKETGDSVHQPI
jgi:hypothetical protein